MPGRVTFSVLIKLKEILLLVLLLLLQLLLQPQKSLSMMPIFTQTELFPMVKVKELASDFTIKLTENKKLSQKLEL